MFPRTRGNPMRVVDTSSRSTPIGLSALLTGLIAFILAAPLATAQEYGGFRGKVTDPTGAIVVSADVTATSESTGLGNSTVTNEVGDFELRGLAPGSYTLEVELSGFKKFINSGLVVYAGQARRINVTLEVGEVADTITVEEEGYVIDTDTPTIKQTTAMTEMVGFNTNAHLIYTIGLNPGNEPRSQVHGSYANNTNTEHMGLATNAYGGSGRDYTETTQELIQTTFNAAAEYRTSTTVMAIGRGGTNKFHGEIFYHLNHPRLNALQPSQSGKPRPPSRPNRRISYEAGGPVYIPRVYDGRNKTFFHWNYQPSSNVNYFLSQNWILPTTKMRQGDLSEFAHFQRTTQGNPDFNIIDPFTGQPFPNDIIPRERWSPVAVNLLDTSRGILPLAHRDRLYDNFDFIDSNANERDTTHMRFDHQITQNNRVTATIWWERWVFDEGGGSPFINGKGLFGDDNRRAFALQDAHTFNPQVINEFSFGWNRQRSVWRSGDFPGRQYLDLLGISDLGGRESLLPNGSGNPRFVVRTLGRQSGAASGSFNVGPANLMGGLGTSPLIDFTEAAVWQLRDTISIQRGSHLIKTGIELRRQFPHKEGDRNTNEFGRWDFTGNFTGYDYGDLLLGLPFTTKIEAITPRAEARDWEFGFFLQDDWKVRPDLTLNLGVRFQHYGTPYEKDDRWYNFDLANRRVVVPSDQALRQVVPGYPIPAVTAREAGYPDRLINFKAVLVDPRIGIAFRPREGTVIRTGYGIYSVPYATHAAQAAGFPVGGFGIDRAGLLAARVRGPYQLVEEFGPNQIVNGMPELTTQRGFPTLTGTLGRQLVYAMDPDLRKNDWPYDQQWNLTIEQELGHGLAMRTSYVGTKGTNWPIIRDLQRPAPGTIPFGERPDQFPYGPGFSTVGLLDLGGNSSHHGFEFEITRQFSSGLYLRGWIARLNTLNDIQGGLFGSTVGLFIEDPYDRSNEKGHQNGFTPYEARIVAVYPLPFGKNQKYGSNLNPFLKSIIGGWTVAPEWRDRNGTRFTPGFSGSDPANVGRSGGRPDLLPGCNPNVGGDSEFKWNAGCFAIPPNGRFGTAPRGMMRGFYTWSFNLNAFKRWHLGYGETGPYFQLEAYLRNILNHPNRGGPSSTNITSPAFGQFRLGGARNIQIRLRLGL